MAPLCGTEEAQTLAHDVNDLELNVLLKAVRMPEPPAGYWDRFPDAIVRRLRKEAEATSLHVRHWAAGWLRWSLGLSTVCLLIGVVVLHRSKPPPPNGTTTLSPSLLREVVDMFPNRVRAILADDAGVQIVLSDRPDIPRSSFLLIRITAGGKQKSVCTFSGQTIEIAGLELEVLADAGGHVLLVGNQTVWSSAQGKGSFAGFQVEAHVLDSLL